MFPSWRYHRTLPACIVEHPEADDALGEGWADTPAAFLEDDGDGWAIDSPIDGLPLELDSNVEPEPDQAADECLSAKTTKKKKRT